MSLEKLPFETPLVDKLSIRIVVDSYYDQFTPKIEHNFVKIEQAKRLPGKQMTTLAGEWGLSLHLVASMAGRNSESVSYTHLRAHET